jgi:hypothetical protein
MNTKNKPTDSKKAAAVTYPFATIYHLQKALINLVLLHGEFNAEFSIGSGFKGVMLVWCDEPQGEYLRITPGKLARRERLAARRKNNPNHSQEPIT